MDAFFKNAGTSISRCCTELPRANAAASSRRVDLYLDMVDKQLTYDALRILDFDTAALSACEACQLQLTGPHSCRPAVAVGGRQAARDGLNAETGILLCCSNCYPRCVAEAL